MSKGECRDGGWNPTPKVQCRHYSSVEGPDPLSKARRPLADPPGHILPRLGGDVGQPHHPEVEISVGEAIGETEVGVVGSRVLIQEGGDSYEILGKEATRSGRGVLDVQCPHTKVDAVW